jgi:hypothetical protein
VFLAGRLRTALELPINSHQNSRFPTLEQRKPSVKREFGDFSSQDKDLSVLLQNISANKNLLKQRG